MLGAQTNSHGQARPTLSDARSTATERCLAGIPHYQFQPGRPRSDVQSSHNKFTAITFRTGPVYSVRTEKFGRVVLY